MFRHSPDGAYAVALAPNATGEPDATMLAVPVSGGAPVHLCRGACQTNWSPDGRFFQVAFHPNGLADRMDVFVIPLAPGHILPSAPPSGFESEADLVRSAGVYQFEVPGTTRVLDPDTYVYVKRVVHRNLYRLSLR